MTAQAALMPTPVNSSALQLRPYAAELHDQWNALIASSPKAHFMFDRRYMDYHADRFTDASYLLEENGRCLAVLPGNIRDNVFYSHQGLTFGGWFPATAGLSTAQTLAATELLAETLRARGVEKLVYKAVPHIYHARPAEEDVYALFRLGAQPLKIEPTTSIDLKNRGRVGSRRVRNRKKADKIGCIYAQSQDWASYWPILSSRLEQRHGLKPVHSLAEIELLASRLPDNIQLYTASSPEHGLLAGVVMYITPLVAHAQYIAANDAGLEHGALDGLFEHLIEQYTPTHRWFDFGISTEDQGRVLNVGLIGQKEEFGGSTVIHTTYSLTL